MKEGKTYRLALLNGGNATVLGVFNASGDLSVGAQTLNDGTYNVVLTEDGIAKQNYATLVIAQPTPDPQLSAVSVNGSALAEGGSTSVESVTGVVASMINQEANKTYKLVFDKSGVQTVIGTFSAQGSLSVGAVTLANGAYSVKLTENDVVKQTWATVTVNAQVSDVQLTSLMISGNNMIDPTALEASIDVTGTVNVAYQFDEAPAAEDDVKIYAVQSRDLQIGDTIPQYTAKGNTSALTQASGSESVQFTGAQDAQFYLLKGDHIIQVLRKANLTSMI